MELISREEAMEAIRAIKEVMLTNGEVINALYHVPTIESRPKGEWEKHKRALLHAGAKEYVGVKYHECSNCKQEAEVLQAGGGCELLSDFCPHCGADMRGKE